MDPRELRLARRRERLQQQDEMADANANQGGQDAVILAALEAIVARLQPAAPAFHRSPARSNINNLIDFKIEPGKGIYKESQKGEADKYDLSKLGLMPFTQSIKEAAQRLGCSIGPTSVCHFTPADGEPAVNIIDHYGEVSKD